METYAKQWGAQLIYRNKENGEVMKQFEMDRNRLEACMSGIGTAGEDAWKIYRKEQATGEPASCGEAYAALRL